jgi:hypothetical protein
MSAEESGRRRPGGPPQAMDEDHPVLHEAADPGEGAME